MTKTILQNVEVLAAGGVKEVGKKKGRISASVVTLSLTPEESDKLALAATAGSIWLSMRNLRDKALSELEPVSVNELIPLEKAMAGAGPEGKPEEGATPGEKSKGKAGKSVKGTEKKKPRGYVVEILHGGEKTEAEF